MENLQDLLRKKSIEAFLLAIEIYNKPTIKYRVEGFALFAINAWELMLKAYLIKKHGESSIYFPDNPNRTISLEGCLRKVFTNEKDPLRLNLEKIIELRNTSTHFITREYEFIYVPLFQACVDNFTQKLRELLEEDITNYIPENFLVLPVSVFAFNEAQIRGKYSDPISAKLIEVNNKITKLQESTSSGRFAVRVIHDHYITKDRSKATETLRIAKDGESPVMVLKDLKDPKDTHPFTAKTVIEKLREKLLRNSIQLIFRGQHAEMNIRHFSNLCKLYELKEKKKYCYVYKLQKNPQFSYSQATIEFLYGILSANPEKLLDEAADKVRRNGGR
jgi:hypothetical protein